MATTLVVYSDTSDLMALLGPKGWSCSATYGADGSGGIALYASNEAVPTGQNRGPLYPPASDEAITAMETGGSPVQAAAEACPFFPAAATATQSDLGHGCSSPPTSQAINQISTNAVGFEDPPGVAGTGNPSGGPYPANGVVTYSATVQPGTYVGTCTLPQSEHALCTSVLNYFVSLHGTTPVVTLGDWTGIEPTTIGFSVDNGNVVMGIVWSSWTSIQAIGTGTMTYYTGSCDGVGNPNCPSVQEAVTIEFTNPMAGNFTTVTETNAQGTVSEQLGPNTFITGSS